MDKCVDGAVVLQPVLAACLFGAQAPIRVPKGATECLSPADFGEGVVGLDATTSPRNVRQLNLPFSVISRSSDFPSCVGFLLTVGDVSPVSR